MSRRTYCSAKKGKLRAIFMFRPEQEEEDGRGNLEDATPSPRLSELREEIGRLKQRLVPAGSGLLTVIFSLSLLSLTQLVHRKRAITAAVS